MSGATPIRDATPERDAAACLAIYGPFIRDTVISFEEVLPSVEQFAERIRAAQQAHAWLVFEDDGEVVGYAYATQHRSRAAYRWATDVTIYVAQSHHRRGIARRLYEALFDRLRAQGYQVACAGVTLPNEASVALHRALGFEPVGVYRRIGWKFGRWHDVAWWQLELELADGSQPAEPGPLSG